MRGEPSVAVALRDIRSVISEVSEGVSPMPFTGHRVFGNGGHNGV